MSTKILILLVAFFSSIFSDTRNYKKFQSVKKLLFITFRYDACSFIGHSIHTNICSKKIGYFKKRRRMYGNIMVLVGVDFVFSLTVPFIPHCPQVLLYVSRFTLSDFM